MLRQDVPERGLGRIQLTNEHLAIGVVDPVHDIVGFRACGLFEPGQGFFILADQRVHRTDQVVDDGFAVLVLDGFGQRGIRKRQLPAERILSRKVSPRSPVLRLQLGHRTEGARSNASLVQLDGNQPD